MIPEICPTKADDYHPSSDHVTFMPLGGSGEIGMNVNLFGFDGQWLMVDLGISFGDERFPAIDVIMPNVEFISARRDRLKGLVITHAHEDHLGAIPYIWPWLQCPIYATPFTAQIIRNKLEETNFRDEVTVIEIPLEGSFTIGHFDLRYVSMTHSIPEPNGLVIEAGGRRILHSGDWKIDQAPGIGGQIDAQAFTDLGDQGVDVFIGDSTNATHKGVAGSEGHVREELFKLFEQFDEERIVVTCFASNVARVKAISQAAEENGRSVILVGRSLWKMTDAARQCGYMEGVAPFLTEDAVNYLPKSNQLIICTGSQGESRAGLARIARNEHPIVRLTKNDVVIFSSKKIPGNEKAVQYVQNKLIENDITVITDKDADIHVSGHPCIDELVTMYNWVRPKMAIPVHGEMVHMKAHEKIAKSCHVQQTIVPHNGGIYAISENQLNKIGSVDVGLLGVDNRQVIPLDSLYIRKKKKSLYEGVLVVSAVVDQYRELIDHVEITMIGIMDPETSDGQQLEADIINAVEFCLDHLSAKDRKNLDKVREQIRISARRQVRFANGKRPVTEVHLLQNNG